MELKPVVIASEAKQSDTRCFGRCPQHDIERHPERSEGSRCQIAASGLFAVLAMTVFTNLLLLLFTPSLFSAPSEPAQEPTVNFLFRDTYYVSPTSKLKYEIYEAEGLLLVREAKRPWHSAFSVVTGFDGPVLESRVLKNIRTIDEARKFLEKNLRKIFFERIPIRELPLIQKDGTLAPRFWVGQRAFGFLERAKASIIETKTAVEVGGGNFGRSLELISEYFPEEAGPTVEEVRANYIREEELALKMMDWLDVGETLYGPLMGTPMGEPILWQSFGETSFRTTNLDNKKFDAQVGYWSNRIVAKGIRTFLTDATIDPYVEVTAALESNGKNFPKHLDLIAGLEYRPFGRSVFLYNFNLDGLYLLRFARNYRFFAQYMERKNLTDEIADSRDADFWAGVDIFYEWGLDLERTSIRPRRERISSATQNGGSAIGLGGDWINDFVWGEYFGSYRWERTDFSTNRHYHSWILNSSVIVGVKWPAFNLPRNPVNDELVVMPYLRLEHTTNPNRDELSHQNRAFLAAGVRWMPFRSFQFEHNEWLYKTKIFAEYVGIGGVAFPGGAHSTGDSSHDWRVGVNVSFKRY